MADRLVVARRARPVVGRDDLPVEDFAGLDVLDLVEPEAGAAALDRAGQFDLDLGAARGGLELPLRERRAADQGDYAEREQGGGGPSLLESVQ